MYRLPYVVSLQALYSCLEFRWPHLRSNHGEKIGLTAPELQLHELFFGKLVVAHAPCITIKMPRASKLQCNQIIQVIAGRLLSGCPSLKVTIPSHALGYSCTTQEQLGCTVGTSSVEHQFLETTGAQWTLRIALHQCSNRIFDGVS